MPTHNNTDKDPGGGAGVVEGSVDLPPNGRSKVRRWVMSALGLGLLGGAGYFVYSATDGLDGVWDSLSSAPWWMIALILIGPMGNHLSVSMCLQALQSRHGKVGVFEMFMLVGSAWLFNYLPMRAGLIGRIGYHKSVNNIRLRDSLESSIWSGVLAGIANGVLLLVAMVMTCFDGGWTLGLPGIPVLVMFASVLMMPSKRSRLMMLALAYRQIDVIVWLGRYWLAFEVLGLEMSIGDIAVVSAVSQLASLMPLTGSGLGFREWTVGLMATVGGHAMGTAMAGDLINRAAETMVVVPVGLICTGLVARHWKRRGGGQQGGQGRQGGQGGLASAEDDPRADTSEQDQPRNPGQQEPAEG